MIPATIASLATQPTAAFVDVEATSKSLTIARNAFSSNV